MYDTTARLFVSCILLLNLISSGPAHASVDILDAVKKKDHAVLDELLNKKINVNMREADGATALHWAVYQDDLEMVSKLLRAEARVSVANRAGITPLILAVVNGNASITKLLIDKGADPDYRMPNGETVLMMAVRTGDKDTIKVLLDHGAEVNATEKLRGTTALMWASAYHNPAAVRLLLEHGADVSMRSKITRAGRGPYLAPTAKDRIEAYKLGIGLAGASIPVDLTKIPETNAKLSGLAPDVLKERRLQEQAEKEGKDPDQLLAEKKLKEREKITWGGLTALVFAARENDLESIRILLDAGADINQVTEYGWTALLTATQNRHYRLGSFLLENGADPNIANNGGWTPLYIATDNRNIEGGDYPTRRPDMDHLDYIKLLLRHGADPNTRMKSSTETRTIFTHQWLYEEGATPFLRAAQSSDLLLMRLLLEHGADPLIPTEHGVTPLMVAAGIGWVEGVTYEWSREANLETVKLLLDLGADVNAQDHVDQRTALMGAAHKGRSEIVQLLVDHGADLSIHDIGSRDSLHKLAGKTWQAVDYADGLVRVGVQSAISHPETAKLIRQLMADAGLEVPPEGRTIDSICVVDLCK